MNRGRTGTTLKKTKQTALEKIWTSLSDKTLERKTMAIAPTTAEIRAGETSSITNSIRWPSISAGGTTSAYNASFFTYTKCSSLTRAGGGSPNTYLLQALGVTTSAVPAYGTNLFGVQFFHDGQELEILIKYGKWLFKVDGEYISLTASSFDSTVQRFYIDFGNRKRRKIECLGTTSPFFGGVQTGPNDTIERSLPIGPKCVFLGDSFTSGSGATNASIDAVPAFFADALGWENVISSGVGGTGYLDNNTTKTTFRQRIDHDVVSIAPDIVVIAGGLNDLEFSEAQIYTEAKLLYSELLSKIPGVTIVVVSPFWYGGPSKITAAAIGVRNGTRQAATEMGLLYIDMLEMDISDNVTITTGTLAANTLAGATSFTSSSLFPAMSTVSIGNDRVMIKTVSGTASPFTHTIDGTLLGAHTSGDVITQIGNCFWTGTGKVGTPSGFGNSDFYVSSIDGLHPSDAGHAAIGTFLAKKVKNAILDK